MVSFWTKWRWIWRSYMLFIKKEISLEEFKTDLKFIDIGLEPPRGED